MPQFALWVRPSSFKLQTNQEILASHPHVALINPA